MWLDDLGKLIVDAGYGVIDTTLFFSSKASFPVTNDPGMDPLTGITETGGTGGQRTQNRPGTSYERPGAQIVVIAFSYPDAKNRAKQIHTLFDNVSNRTINNIWYIEIRPLQEPFDFGKDEIGRPRSAFNVLGWKRPS